MEKTFKKHLERCETMSVQAENNFKIQHIHVAATRQIHEFLPKKSRDSSAPWSLFPSIRGIHAYLPRVFANMRSTLMTVLEERM